MLSCSFHNLHRNSFSKKVPTRTIFGRAQSTRFDFHYRHCYTRGRVKGREVQCKKLWNQVDEWNASDHDITTFLKTHKGLTWLPFISFKNLNTGCTRNKINRLLCVCKISIISDKIILLDSVVCSFLFYLDVSMR
jgi:hypothetical protein